MKQAIIQWRLRRDVELHPAGDSDGAWTIKDPVKLSYFRVEAEELALLQMLDGRRSWSDAITRLSAEFPDSEFSEQNLQMFLATAIKAGILSPVGVGFGAQMAVMAQQAKSSAVYRKFFSLISHRFRGIDPSRLLRILDQLFGWIFRPAVLRLAAGFVLVAAVLILSRWTQLWSELPSISQLVTPQNAMMLGVTVVFIKILHEIGHGLTCHHYGGECHELGCIVVGFLPLLYCDVSDTWLQQNRVYRIFVSAAGIAVELFLAAVFGLLWMASVPGTLHTFFLNVMLVSSLNTVLVNGNPLLRYDGYYVLCDLIRIPNLGLEARAAAHSVFDQTVLGLRQPMHASMPFVRRLWLPVFGAASIVYRFVVLFAILMVIHAALKPLRLEGVAWFLALTIGFGMVISMMAFVRQRIAAVRRNGTVSSRAVIGLAGLSAVLAAVLFWPLPYSIVAPFTLTPGQSLPVYVAEPGYADVKVAAGDQVSTNETLATLRNPDLELSIVDTEGELRLRKAQVRHLTGTRSASAIAAAALPASEVAVASARERLASLRQKSRRLVLKSPADGNVYPPRSRRRPTANPLGQTFWSGTPLDAPNQSTWLNEQTLVAWIGTQELVRAVVYVPQQTIEFVQPDRLVDLTFHSLPGQPIFGVVRKVNDAPETVAPAELAARKLLLVQGPEGQLVDTVFAAHVQLNQKDGELPPLYSTGYATIECQPTSLAARAWRVISHTFAFEL